jgi:hypothetical protein
MIVAAMATRDEHASRQPEEERAQRIGRDSRAECRVRKAEVILDLRIEREEVRDQRAVREEQDADGDAGATGLAMVDRRGAGGSGGKQGELQSKHAP